MKSPRGRPSFSRPQRLELFKSWSANGIQLPILGGSPAGAAAGGPGGSSLATSAPNPGHAGSMRPAPSVEHRNPKIGKDKGKGNQGKAESSRSKELPASQATTRPKAALPQGKRPQTHPEARGRPMLEAVQGFHALGKKKDLAAADRTPQAIPETREHLSAPAGASIPAPEVLRFPPLPSPLRAMEQPKGFGASKASAVRGDRGMPGQGKLFPDKAPADRGAEAEEEGPGPRKKRKKDPPEPSPEARRKRRSSLSNHWLEPGKKNHKMSGQSKIQDRPSPEEISEHLEAPEEALARIRHALRLPPLLSPLREVEQAKGLGARKVSVAQVDTHSQEPGKKKHKVRGQSKIQDRQPPAEISKRWEAPEEALARILDAMRLPPLLSPLRKVEKLKGLGAPKDSTDQMERGRQPPRKRSPDKKTHGRSGKPGPKAALPGSTGQKQTSPETWITDVDTLSRRMLEVVEEFNALGKKKEDLAAAVRTPQDIAKIQERLEAPAGASTIPPVALRLPPLLSLSWKVEKPKGLGSPKDSTDPMARGQQIPRKGSPDTKPPGRSAKPGPKAALPESTGQKQTSPETWITDVDILRRRMLEVVEEFNALGKKKEHLAAAVRTPQDIAKIQERLEAPAGASTIPPVALRLPPLLSLSWKVEKPKGLGSPKDSTDPMARGQQIPRKGSPDTKPPGRSAKPGPKAALPESTGQKQTSPETWITDVDTLSRRMLEVVEEFNALGKKKEDLAAAVRTPQDIAKIQERLEAPAGASTIPPVALRLPPLLSLSWKVEKPKGLGSPKDSTDPMARGQQIPRKGSPDTKPPGRSAKPGPKAGLPGSTGQKHTSPEACITHLHTLHRRMLEAVLELRSLGKREDKRAGLVRAPQPPAQAQVRLQAPAEVSETALEASGLPTRHFPSRGLEHPKDIGNTRARGEQADRGLRGPPKPWRGRGLSESGAEPQEEEAPLSNKRKRGHPEPTPEVRNKLPTFLSATKNKERMVGWVGVPWPTPKMQERGGTPAEGPAPTRTQGRLWAAARDWTWKAEHRPARPIPQATARWGAGAFRSPAPREEWRAERERLRRKAQQERELAAQYTALGRRNFFEERQKDMEISRYYGYVG